MTSARCGVREVVAAAFVSRPLFPSLKKKVYILLSVVVVIRIKFSRHKVCVCVIVLLCYPRSEIEPATG